MAPQSQGAGAADGDGASSDGFPLILTGSADDMLRGYLVLLPEMLEDKEISSLKDQNDQLLHYCGCVKLSGGEHCAGMDGSFPWQATWFWSYFILQLSKCLGTARPSPLLLGAVEVTAVEPFRYVVVICRRVMRNTGTSNHDIADV